MKILPVSGAQSAPEPGALVPDGGALAPCEFAPELHAPSVYLAGLAPGSRRAMKGVLELCARLLSSGRLDASTLPWGALRFQHTAALRAVLADSYAPAYANKTLSALKGTLKAAWRLGQIETEAYQRAIDIQNVKGERLPKGRALSRGELLALFQACATENGFAGARDAALLAVLAGAGLRRSEVVALDLADYNARTGALSVQRGKGNKGRQTFLGADAREAMSYWLRLRGDAPGPLFVPLARGRPRNDGVKRGLDASARRLTDQSVMDILLKRLQQSGIADASPHDFRRTFISTALENGADLATVQKLVGHSSPQTTERYDRRGDETKKRAAELVTLPYIAPASALAARKTKKKKS